LFPKRNPISPPFHRKIKKFKKHVEKGINGKNPVGARSVEGESYFD